MENRKIASLTPIGCCFTRLLKSVTARDFVFFQCSFVFDLANQTIGPMTSRSSGTRLLNRHKRYALFYTIYKAAQGRWYPLL